jgi:hypothetical protein
MKKFLFSMLAAVLLLASLTGLASAAISVTDPAMLQDLAEVRQATTKYHDVNVAIADGYMPTTSCIAGSAGGMGFHYVNPTLARDSNLNLTTPEILLYASVGGELKLVGVEYFFGIGRPDARIPDPAPRSPILFGRTFNGPMLGHEAGMPPHYDLHVWVWQANPEGLFTQFNPNVGCQ